jgi:hypothetical protein
MVSEGVYSKPVVHKQHKLFVREELTLERDIALKLGVHLIEEMAAVFVETIQAIEQIVHLHSTPSTTLSHGSSRSGGQHRYLLVLRRRLAIAIGAKHRE